MTSKINYIKRGTKYIIGVGAMIAGFSSAAFGLDREGEYYIIGNGANLKEFATIVNNGNIRAKGKIVDNIILNGGNVTENGELKTGSFEAWDPIRKFEGELISGDGGTKTITGLYINNDASGQGLFDDIREGGTVKDIKISGSYIKGDRYMGGIAGENRGRIENCIIDDDVIIKGKEFVGGNVGWNLGTIERCENNGRIEGEKCVGGNVGEINNGKISECNNIGEVKGKEKVGGNVGEIYIGEIYEGGTIERCGNNGRIEGEKCVGGNVGEINNGKISECNNIGEVEGDDFVGGNVICVYLGKED